MINLKSKLCAWPEFLLGIKVFYLRKKFQTVFAQEHITENITVKQCTLYLKKWEIFSTVRISMYIVQYDNLVFILNAHILLYITVVFFLYMGCPMFIAVYCTVYIHTVGSQISIMQSWILTYTLHNYIYMSNVSGVYYSKYHGYIYLYRS
jgi:hypothetical protein